MGSKKKTALEVTLERMAQLEEKNRALRNTCAKAHDAIDILFAKLIEIDKTFMPSKSGLPWEAIVETNTAMKADDTNKKKPSDFADHFPYSSVKQNTEHEIIAHNIMVILKRTGNRFRTLTWPEYRTERMKDGQYNDGEREYFDGVIGFCLSENTARTFCDDWANV